MSRPNSKAVAHYKRTGLIPPGHQAEVAAYLAATNGGEQP